MPCYDSRNDNPQIVYRSGRKRDQKEIDRLTRMLCALCKRVDRKYPHFVYPRELQAWWTAHKLVDKVRASIGRKT